MGPRRLAVIISAAAIAGVALESSLESVRSWTWNHAFANGVLVGVLLITATYLVVERVLEARERERWARAAGPLLRAIALAGEAADKEVRTAQHQPDPGWLGQLIESYQAVLTATPELVTHWHAALSLLQHARAVDGTPTADYELAWERFVATFADVHDFGAARPSAGATWAAIPSVPGRSGAAPPPA
jgi:hypothetical protein